MQKAAHFVDAKETGIEIEVMPAESYEAEKSAPGRVGAVVSTIFFRENHHTVFLPSPYAEVLKRRY